MTSRGGFELAGSSRRSQFVDHNHQPILETRPSFNSNNNMNSSDDFQPLQNHTTSAPPPQDAPPPPQTLDSYLEDAFQSTKGHTPWRTFQQQWKFWCILLSLGVANSSDASEILCLSYILSDQEFSNHFLQSKDGGGTLAAAVFLGMLLGGLIVGTLGDWWGRRPMLLMGLACNSVAGVLSSLAPTVGILSLLRFVSGLGIGATVPPLFTLVTELAPPSTRGFCVTLCASFWMVGSMFVAIVALWMLEDGLGLSWRVFALVCALPSALGAFLIYFLVPESPRFLGLEQRHKEATENANTLGRAMGYHGAPLTEGELIGSFASASIQSSERSSRSRHTPRMECSLSGILSLLRVVLQDFFESASKLYTPGLQRTTFPLQIVWFSLSFGSYGLMTWINTIFVEVNLQNVYFNALLFAASNLPGNIMTALLMDRVGRGPLLIGSVVAAASSLVLFAFSANTSWSTGIVLSACLFQCFTISAWNTIDTMTSELFPTTVRSTGMGVCAASGRIGAMVAQFVNGALVSSHPVQLLLVAAGTLLVGAATPCMLPHGIDMTGKAVQDGISMSATDRSHSTSYQGKDFQYKDNPSGNLSMHNGVTQVV